MMAARWVRLLLILAMPLVLTSCLFTPGKFTATLDIGADRSFAFTFVGEVISVDPSAEMAKGMAGMMAAGAAKGGPGKSAATTPSPTATADAKAELDRKNRQIAETLSKELGYRKVDYLGDGRFMVDYAIKGVLDHDFVYPVNLDAAAIVMPFIALELRNGSTVRVKAPAFAKAGTDGPFGGMSDAATSKLDGIFTLSTDAEIVSQNNEDGVKTVGGRKTIVWHATPLSKDAPTAVLRFAGGK